GREGHGWDGHERRGGDGRGVRGLRDAADARHQADGRRPRRRRLSGRHRGARRAAPGRDEAARRLELVPAPVAALAAEALAGATATVRAGCAPDFALVRAGRCSPPPKWTYW